ncbi:MAG: hypothetical protein NTZ12_00590 [Candidatus Aminicenantes bacterium]|nr:hypothetical protein [Candidatus Aminicenantes bacterium]
MRFVKFYKKTLSMIVMVTFTILLCFWANPSPAASAATDSKKSSTTSLANGEDNSPGFIEEDEPEPIIKKGGKFPWLIVGAALVIGAAAVYFLVIKKPEYTLTVTMGAGAVGTPAATAKYKKGEAVAYNYTPLAGYGSLQVTLDGAAVAASGTVTMNGDHTLSVSAAKKVAIITTRSIPSPVPYSNDDGGYHYWQFRYEITESAGVGAQLVSWFSDMYDINGVHINHQVYTIENFADWFVDCGGTSSHIAGNSTRCSGFWYRSTGNEQGWRVEETLEFNDDNGNKVIVISNFTFLAIPGYSSFVHENPTELNNAAPQSGSGKGPH